MAQIKNKLDRESVGKIFRGAAIASTAAFGLYLLSALGAIEIESPVLVSLLAWFIPFATNAIKEWKKGAELKSETQ